MNIINPFIKENYQLLIAANKQESGLISFSLKNFLRDDKGRFIFISPSSSEIEEMKNSVREEMLNAKAEAEKQALEEGLEASSLIEKTKAAPIIEGLRFDKETGFYLAKEINDYGLRKDAKAGIFKNGLLALNPDAINFLQQQEEGLGIPLPFSVEDINDLKIAEVNGVGYSLLIRLSKGVTIYSPLNGFCYDGRGESLAEPIKGSYQAFFFDREGKTVLNILSKEIKYFSHKEKVIIGDKLGEVSQDILLELVGCDVLKIGDNPVFILPNE